MYKSINFVSTDNTETGDALGQPNIEKQFHQPKDLYLLQPVLSLGHMHCSLLWSSCTNEVLLTEGQQLCFVHCFK